MSFLRAIRTSTSLGPSKFNEHDIYEGMSNIGLGPSEFKKKKKNTLFLEGIPRQDKSIAF